MAKRKARILNRELRFSSRAGYANHANRIPNSNLELARLGWIWHDSLGFSEYTLTANEREWTRIRKRPDCLKKARGSQQGGLPLRAENGSDRAPGNSKLDLTRSWLDLGRFVGIAGLWPVGLWSQEIGGVKCVLCSKNQQHPLHD